MDHLVSVLIPHYDRAALLAKTLQSLVNQRYSNWEALVVDDGSATEIRDEVQQITGRDSRVRLLHRTAEPKGPSMCRNLALENSRGEFVVFLDSDDLLAPWCLEDRVRQLSAHPQTDFAVFPAMVFRSQPGDQNVLWNNLDSNLADVDRFLRGTPPWCIASTIWRIEALRRIGGLNERLRYGEDAELHLRALVAGLAGRHVSNALPDVFIRRDETKRFTNVISDELLAAKRNYIGEGFQLLRSGHGNPEQVVAWERRYFEELEFLIYNVNDNGLSIQQLLADWVNNYRPSAFTRWLFGTYGAIGRLTRRRAYLVLRVFRRVVLGLMPTRFHAPAEDRGFETASLPPEQFETLQERLGKSQPRS